MERLEEMEAIQDAYKILRQAELETSAGVIAVYAIVVHANKHLSDRMELLLRESEGEL